MNAVDLLCRFLTAYKFSLPVDQVGEMSGLTVLSKLGVIEFRRSGTACLCDACDFPHSIEIGIDPVTDMLGWRCPEAGFVEVASDRLEEVRFLPDALVVQLANALQCQRRREAPLIKNTLWRVGWYELEANDVNVYLSSRLRDVGDASAIAGALRAEPGLRNGLVITPEISGTAGLTIAGCRFAEIRDVVKIEDDGLSCDQSRIATLAGILSKRRGGRPLHLATEEATALIRERYDKGIYADGKRAEAREIMRQLGVGSPKQTKLYEMISDIWGDQ